MKIKRYTAPSMRAALALVRSEQGADAVILSSSRGEDGIEVIAAVDYDEALFADAKRQRAAVSAPAPAQVQAQSQARAPAPARAAAAAAPSRTRESKLIPAHFQRLTMSSLPVAAVLQDSLPASA